MLIDLDEPGVVITQHSMFTPVLYRVNPGNPKDGADHIFWNHSEKNRFCLEGCEQTYLATTLDAISEATPWREFLYNGYCEADDGNTLDPREIDMCPVDRGELEDFFVSYIVPDKPLRLLDLVHNKLGGFRVGPGVISGEDLSSSVRFSEALYQVADEYDIDGIYYPSKFTTYSHNIYVTDRARDKLSDKSVIHHKPLLDALEPLREEIYRSLRVTW